MQEEGDHSGVVTAHQPVKLAQRGQGWKGRAQLFLGVAVEVPLALEAVPLAKDSQGYYLATRQGGLGTWPGFLRPLGFAEVIDHNLE